MAILTNPLQKNEEPTYQETWYSSLVKIVETDISNSTLSRYRNKRIITLFDNTTFIEFIRKSMIYTPVAAEDQYYFTPAGKKNRPDLLSYELYGTPIFYWIILSDNNLVSPLQMSANLTLRVPSLPNIVNDSKII
jgi:hypothetical protein